ncbi:MAG: hypothetical protein WDO24_14905 [Pseudomonadota bacterium]
MTGIVSLTGNAVQLADSAVVTLGASSVGSLMLTADQINTVTNMVLTGGLTIQQLTASRDIRLGGASALAGVLDVNDAVLGGFSGYTDLTIGRSTGTGR